MTRIEATPGQPPKRARVRSFYLAVLVALIVVAVAAKLTAPGSVAAALGTVFAVLWSVPGVFACLRWLWRKLTYRVGVRFFLSYLLIGLTPFLLMAILAGIVGYILVGQYGSVRLGQELDTLGEHLAVRAAGAVQELGATGSQPATTLLASPIWANGPLSTWVLARGKRVWRPEGSGELTVPEWAPEGSWRGTVVVGKTLEAAAIERRADTIAAVLVPLDVANAPKVSKAQWFQARFVTHEPLAKVRKQREGTVTVTVVQGDAKGESGVRIGGENVPSDQVEPGWVTAEGNIAAGVEPRPPGGRGDRWHRMRLPWARALDTPRNWLDGSSASGKLAFAVMKVSVGGAADDFFAGPRKMGSEVRTAITASAMVFGVMYLIAVSFAVVMILSVARSTARLTRGARAVARGDLDYRIPVKRRDQLGDLAVSFNAMTESVKTMLVQVAEKERMAREMELTREIQESLLPPSELSAGPLSVWAHFRPATEVGGDYFDLFPLSSGRLMVAVGDVAGHGLHTGLLMAMVKSAVATLVQEGHTGRLLLERLNHLLLGQSIKHRMVSLALAEIDASRGVVEITSAGHPPGMLLAGEGDVEELLLSSLPLGHRWPEPPPSRSRAFGPGSRLLLYSDGLVEARAAGGEPFGYEALRGVLQAHREAPAATLVSAVLAALDRHLNGEPLADDLTLLLAEHRRTQLQTGSA
ncbi:MAG: SpoIIE family protein phosphatase [Acidobacteriia bacterium]|nr:SpoIIE family protein phosphatase [Terriglobia bacterium]